MLTFYDTFASTTLGVVFKLETSSLLLKMKQAFIMTCKVEKIELPY